MPIYNFLLTQFEFQYADTAQEFNNKKPTRIFLFSERNQGKWNWQKPKISLIKSNILISTWFQYKYIEKLPKEMIGRDIISFYFVCITKNGDVLDLFGFLM